MLALAMGSALRFVKVFKNIRALYLTDFEGSTPIIIMYSEILPRIVMLKIPSGKNL